MAEYYGGWVLFAIYAAGYLFALKRPEQHWRIARTVSAAALIATLMAVIGALLWLQFSPLEVDALGMTGALLVALLGWVVIKYSHAYLAGEAAQQRFASAMLFTLAAISLLVLSRNLLVIVLAWSGTSIGLHVLLTHYRERKAAQVAAHKKFLVSRLAELCLLVALVLVYQAADTLSLDGLNHYLGSRDTLPHSLYLASLLFVLAVILKSAQLPLHGWLIQVMEAPTPVSALLHAGIVNIGGFVLIRLAELLSLAPTAQAVLVIVGSLTAVLASLVMMTRISIKVRLAWSTCAQMGFMLMEVGLGLYELALLHLVAHSLYKAHAFLNAGETVNVARQHDFLRHRGKHRSPAWYLAAVAVSALLVFGSGLAWQTALPDLALPVIALAIMSLGLAPLLWLEQGHRTGLALRAGALLLGLTQLYMLWHLLFSGLVSAANPASTGLMLWALLSLAALYVAQVWLRCYPRGRVAELLYPWAYCGFYLDETYTRLVFRVWPIKLNNIQARTLVNRNPARYGDDL